MTAAEETDRLGASRFISLTTYRRDGTAVPTPVWVVRDGSHLLVWTGKTSGKAKRLRHSARVTVTASGARGTPRGQPVSGTARFLPDAELPRVERLVAAKYRIGWPALRLLDGVLRLVRRHRQPSEQVGVEITLA
jgi:uncharacterized protein